jgi:hypothetical protein
MVKGVLPIDSANYELNTIASAQHIDVLLRFIVDQIQISIPLLPLIFYREALVKNSGTSAFFTATSNATQKCISSKPLIIT